ncbi:MAG: Bax inhibitor-1/YccA family protein [Myxococcales bacterium]|nr:Bax inhibitor-1/YccA family protein [Myxococcales bacterium]
MSYAAFQDRAAAYASERERADFIRLTYLHLGGAILAFIGLTAALVNSELGLRITETMLGGRFSWLIVLGAFMGVGWIAQRWAASGGSPAKQYLGLGLYVVAEAIIFTPLLYIAAFYAGPSVIPTAGLLTAIVFGGLTATALLTKKDFSFMGRALSLGGFAAMGVIVVSLIFGFNLGTLFSGAMVLLAGGYVLYYTSNVLHHYPVGAHVAAALALFSAVALLFWYILRIVMAVSGRR